MDRLSAEDVARKDKMIADIEGSFEGDQGVANLLVTDVPQRIMTAVREARSAGWTASFDGMTLTVHRPS